MKAKRMHRKGTDDDRHNLRIASLKATKFYLKIIGRSKGNDWFFYGAGFIACKDINILLSTALSLLRCGIFKIVDYAMELSGHLR